MIQSHNLRSAIFTKPSTRLASRRSYKSIQQTSAYAADAFDLRRELRQAVQQQAASKVQKLRQELIDPWFAPAPQPLQDTQDPELLGDPDSVFVDVGGLRVHCKICEGDTSQPALLLLHGFNGSTFNWRHVMQPIAEGSPAGKGPTVIAFDRPPFGLTQRPLTWNGGADADPYTCKGGARLAGQLLDVLGIETAVVCGHSMGAVVAMEMLRMRPQQVAGLVMVAPALPTRPDHFRRSMNAGQQLQSLARMALMRSDTAGLVYVRDMLTKQAARVTDTGTGVHHDRSKALSPEVVQGYLKPMKAKDWDRGSLLGFRAFSFPDNLPRYETIQQPVLLIQGAEDKTIPRKTAQQIVARLEDRQTALTQYVEFEHCGHIPMEENPAAFIEALSVFLAAARSTEHDTSTANTTLRQLNRPDLEPVAETMPAAAAGTTAAKAEAVR